MKELTSQEIKILRLALKFAGGIFILGLVVLISFKGATSTYIALSLGACSLVVLILALCYGVVADHFNDSRKETLLIGCAAVATTFFPLVLSISPNDSITILITICFIGLIIYCIKYKDKNED